MFIFAEIACSEIFEQSAAQLWFIKLPRKEISLCQIKMANYFDCQNLTDIGQVSIAGR